MNARRPRLGFLAILALLLVGSLALLVAPAGADQEEAVIYAKSLDTKECGSEWHWVITGIDPTPAPASIWVKWGDNSVTEVPLWKVTGNVAHYADYSHSVTDQVLSAWTTIKLPWNGQFNLSHRSCATPTATPVPPTSTPTEMPTNTPTATPTVAEQEATKTPTATVEVPSPTATVEAPSPTATATEEIPSPTATVEVPSPTATVEGQEGEKTPTATTTPAPTATVLGSEATKVPTATPDASELPKTGGPQEGSLALVGLVLALGGVLAYRLASGQPTTK